MNSLKNIKNGASNFISNDVSKYAMLLVGGFYGIRQFTNKDSKTKAKDDKIDDKINIENLKLDQSRNARHVTVEYVKHLIESSINCHDIHRLKESIEVLEGVISGYEVLHQKCIEPEYHIDYILYKLNKYRIKSYYNLACLYLDICDYNLANYYFIKSLDSCDKNDCNHHKYIHNIFCKLEKTQFIC